MATASTSSSMGARERVTTSVRTLERRARLLVDEVAARRQVSLFETVEAYCQFIGFGRSGHSLVGAMLDAHPDMIIANEANGLGQLDQGASRAVLFNQILRTDRAFAARGFVQADDVYEIPGQWQGRVRRLRVIGDKNGGRASLLLASKPDILDRLRTVVAVPLRVMVVVRNPFDNVARMATRGNLTLLTAAANYERMALAVDAALTDLHPGEALVVRHEETVADPESALVRMAEHLGVDPLDDWVKASASIVLPSPRTARGAVEWTDGCRAVVADMTERFEFLAGYTFDD